MLDSATAAEVMAIFQQLNHQGITIVLVTHEPDVARYARRAVFFRDGRVVDDRPVDDHPTEHALEARAPSAEAAA
jgi:putative ABC transport system ATP-binding protein